MFVAANSGRPVTICAVSGDGSLGGEPHSGPKAQNLTTEPERTVESLGIGWSTMGQETHLEVISRTGAELRHQRWRRKPILGRCIVAQARGSRWSIVLLKRKS